MYPLQIPATASRAAAERIRALRTQLFFSQAVEDAWIRVFSEDERQRLGKACPDANLIAVYCELRKVTAARAILDLAIGIGLIDQATYRWLLDEIHQRSVAPAEKPEWCRSTGKLLWLNILARKVRIMKHPSTVEIILRAFQAAGWPTEIPTPFGVDCADATYQAVHTINQGLKRIQFSARESATVICWLPIDNLKSIPSQSE